MEINKDFTLYLFYCRMTLTASTPPPGNLKRAFCLIFTAKKPVVEFFIAVKTKEEHFFKRGTRL